MRKELSKLKEELIDGNDQCLHLSLEVTLSLPSVCLWSCDQGRRVSVFSAIREELGKSSTA